MVEAPYSKMGNHSLDDHFRQDCCKGQTHKQGIVANIEYVLCTSGIESHKICSLDAVIHEGNRGFS